MSGAMAEFRRRYKGTRTDVDRHGNRRWYTIDPRGKKVRMKEEPGSDAWVEEWDRIRKGSHTQMTSPRFGPQSLGALISQYLASAEFQGLASSTQKTKRRLLADIQNKSGERLARSITPDDIRAGRNARASTPAAANNRMKALSSVYEWGKEHHWGDYNPVRGVKHLKEAKRGAVSWTAEDCHRYEKSHPVGTVARLVYAIALYTGQRRSDICKLGPQHIEGDYLRIQQQKTGTVVYLPIVPPLAEAIEAVETTGLAFAMTRNRKPFTAAGLGNRFREWCQTAGLPDRSMHGLRKALAARLADFGMTAHQVQAVTGHLTLSEVQRYTRAADQKRLAGDALTELFGNKVSHPKAPTRERGLIKGK